MHTDFDADFLATTEGSRANEILRSCVHCGFCNATCPTYQITGDELDGPRGRIYLIRDLLQSGENEARTTRHLDGCLTCRACETTCPSGVQYGELAEIARNHLGPTRSGFKGLIRKLLAWTVPDIARLRFMSRLGRGFRWLLPSRLGKLIPATVSRGALSTAGYDQQILLLNGCAQQVTTAATNLNLQSLLAKWEIGTLLLAEEGCCGSLDLHAGAQDIALRRIKANIDLIYPQLENVLAVVSSASGCGLTIKEWGRVLENDADYAKKAAEVSAATQDASEFVSELMAKGSYVAEKARDVSTVAWHAPCTLQHGQQLTDVVEPLLISAGYHLVEVQDAHLCCGSAGTYSSLEPKMSEELARRKLAGLLAQNPELIATANVGCQAHLGNTSSVPVVHWLELLK